MKTLIFSRQGQSGKADLERLCGELDRLKINYQSVDIDSREGAAQAELYDVVQTPAVLTVQDDGSLLYNWQDMLPNPTDVSRIGFL